MGGGTLGDIEGQIPGLRIGRRDEKTIGLRGDGKIQIPNLVGMTARQIPRLMNDGQRTKDGGF